MMTLERLRQKYLKKNELLLRELNAEPARLFSTVVMIPILAESDYIGDTLKALAENDLEQLADTMVILVINNPPPGSIDESRIADNQKLLAQLRDGMFNHLGLNLFWIDASSAGCEVRKKACAGTARKLGMDAALRYANLAETPIICCLDADTLVQTNYLAAVRHCFEGTKAPVGGVIHYEHQPGETAEINTAIIDYELFLRQYELGLAYAGSPYAYHTIGSTMVCSVEGYIKSGGMKTRPAGEDFYFLQDLRKIGDIALINETTVFPATRVSDRVAFGTGPKMQQVLNGEAIQFYHPEVFENLKKNLDSVQEFEIDDYLNLADNFETCFTAEFAAFLTEFQFESNWRKILKNTPAQKHYLFKAFHTWFDAFRTLKFVHFCENNFPQTFQRLSWTKAFTFLEMTKQYATECDLLNALRANCLT